MTLRSYEMIVVSEADQTDDEHRAIIDKYKELIAKQGGQVKDESPWGRRKLAYEINKKNYGIFHMLYLEADGKIIEEMERQMGYDEKILKYFLLSVNDLEKAKQDFEALKENPKKNADIYHEVLGA